jgi:hypothetical protein
MLEDEGQYSRLNLNSVNQCGVLFEVRIEFLNNI